MTGRNTTSRYSYVSRCSEHDRHQGFGRVFFPLLVLAATLGAAGCMQRDGLGQEDASLSMVALKGTGDASSSGLRIFALGDAQGSTHVGEPGSVSTTLSQWVKNATATSPLPLWVQAHRATTLWSGPDDKAVSLTDLPQWTFLKVVGSERGGRILVNFAGDYANREPGIGWVDNTSVGPADDPGTWVTNHRAATLWSGTDAAAAKFNELPQWTKLRIVDSAPVDATRLEVQFFGDAGTRAPGTAWIARADVGPITPPNPLPAVTQLAPAKQSYSFASDRDFISAVGDAAQRSHATTRVPASVTVAQAILESDWGRSRLTRQVNNLFGIKALNGAGPAGVVTLSTWEHVDDDDVVVQAPFRAYYTLQQSIDDHARFLSARRYAGAMSVCDDPRAFAHELQSAGYATDPSYASKLIGLMDRYNLYRFDS